MKKFYTILLAGTIAFGAVAAHHKMPTRLPKKMQHRITNIATPEVLPATEVTEEGFTANWKAVSGAETYTVLVYEPIQITKAGDYAILDENFNLVSEGSTIEPFFPEEAFVELSDYDWTYTPDWQGFWPVFAKGMVGGIIYSPYIDLTHNNGEYTVNFTVVGYGGAEVRLASEGTTSEEKRFILTETGANYLTATFTNGSHDTYLKFTDYGITDDPDGDYMGYYDFLDEIQVVQTLQAGDEALRLVSSTESSRNYAKFPELPYRYGATDLAYDVQANIVEFGDPDDPWDYEVFYSPWSALEYVTLGTPGEEPGEEPGEDPNNPKVDPEYPAGDNMVAYVGEYEDTSKAEIMDGTWWDRAPFQWYTVHSASQIIYTADMLKDITKGDIVKSISFKYADQGCYDIADASLNVYVGNSSATEFVQKPDSEYYLWHEYNPDTAHQAYLDYTDELYYMQDMEIEFTLEEPIIYNGESLVVTCRSINNGSDLQATASYIAMCDTKNTMVFGSDTVPFDDVLATGVNHPYQTPNKWVPVLKLVYDRPNSVNAIIGATAGEAEYFTLEGIRVANPSAHGIYIRRDANGASKVVK